METVYLLLTRRRVVWRVRILIPGQPRPYWRAYRVAEYPTPEAVARRCAEGLAKQNPEDKAHEGKKSYRHDCIRPVHDSPLRVRWECWGVLRG